MKEFVPNYNDCSRKYYCPLCKKELEHCTVNNTNGVRCIECKKTYQFIDEITGKEVVIK